MVFPYWRIYWNKNSGGVIGYHHTEYAMKPDHLYIISPNTPFYSYIFDKKRSTTGIEVSGRRIVKGEDESVIARQALLHLFIHFNLGVPFDQVEPNIYPVELSPFQINKLEWLTQQLKLEPARFTIPVSLHLQALIFDYLGNLKNELWDTTRIDHRILNAIKHIDKNKDQSPTNAELALSANMAINSFARLFKKEMGVTTQRFIKERKINNACALLDHTELSIEEVAQKTGFADGYHFSRIFKYIKGVSPGRYRKG
jgi:AraC-like DNA-binding protein